MKKLLLLLAATSCCYLQANAGTYTSLSATGSAEVDRLKFRLNPTLSIGYDIFFYNFYMALEVSPTFYLPNCLIFKNDIFMQLGYKIKNNVVLFTYMGMYSLNNDARSGSQLEFLPIGIGVKYFDDNNLVYRVMCEYAHEVHVRHRQDRAALILGVDYRF